MPHESPSHDPLRQLMKHSLVEMPFSDFEARTMHRIREQESVRAATTKDRKLFTVFFVLGVIAGITVSALLSGTGQSWAGIDPERIRISCQLFMALLIVALGNHLYTVIIRKREGVSD